MTPLAEGAEVRRIRVAGFWRRALADAIDGLILLASFAPLVLVTALLLQMPLPRPEQLGPDYLLDLAASGNPLGKAALLMFGLAAFLYFFLFHAARGQTPGKRLLSIAVIDGYGERPSLGRTLARTAACIASALPFALGFVWIGFDREKRALHDWLADTYVVSGRTRKVQE